jgi:quinol monooxygenase YgiN
MKSVVVIVAYRPKPGKTDALITLTKTHVPRLRSEGLLTDREPTILQAADGTIIEMFEWLSPEVIQQAHRNTEVHKMWAEFAEVCDYVPLSELPETKGLFAEFTPLY